MENRFGYELTYEKDGVFFELKPQGEYSSSDILRRIMKKNIQNMDIVTVDSAIGAQDFKKVKIAEPQEEILLDESISVFVDNDKMKAYVSLQAGDEGGKRYTVDSLKKELIESFGVVHGFDDYAIANLLQERAYDQKTLIAQGTPPEHGSHGTIEYQFDTKFHRKGTQIGDRVDYKELDLFRKVDKGDVLAIKIPPTLGVPGSDVQGNRLDAIDGKEASFVYGKNVAEAEDGSKLISEIAGRVDRYGMKVVVSPVYNVNGNVDMTVGNIDFTGDVVVSGNVLDGFTIRAGGDIEIYGTVENAVLFSEKDIRVYSGVRGGGKTQLTAGGEIFARFIEQGSIQAGEKIVAESIMHSNVYCNGPIEVVTGKGAVMGGNITSASSITAINVGADVGVATFITVDVLSSMKDRRNTIKERLEDLREDLKKLKLIRSKMMSTDLIDDEKKEQILHDIAVLGREELELVKEFEDLTRLCIKAKEGELNVKGRIFPGVRLTMGNEMINVKEAEDYVTFKLIDGEIRRMVCKA